MLLSLVVALSLLFGTIGFTGCSEETVSPSSVDDVAESEGDAGSLDLPQLAYSYPSTSLPVPFLPQVKPGDWTNTNNCGQASCVMLGGYFNNGAVAPWVIDEENRSMGCPTGNGCPMGATEIKNLLWNFHRLNTALYNGRAANDVINEVVNNRRPTIFSCRISSGQLVSSGGREHWALVVGWDQPSQSMIINDPGTNSGNHKWVSLSTFEGTWGSTGRKYMPVWK